jgi:prepilin-type processing-associated H-X9-DG protein
MIRIAIQAIRYQTGGPPNGVFQWRGRPIGVRDVTDGTSNTIAMGEFRIGDFNDGKISIPQDVADAPGTAPAGVTRGNSSMVMSSWVTTGGSNVTAWLASCVPALSSSATQKSQLGDSWAFGVMGHSLGNLITAPNPKYPNCLDITGQGDFDNAPIVIGLSSFHPGGANVGICDGSVRFLKDSANMLTIWALGSRGQGEIVDASSY